MRRLALLLRNAPVREVLSHLCPGLPGALVSSGGGPKTMLTALVKERCAGGGGGGGGLRWEVCTADELSALKSSREQGSVLLGAAVDDLVLHACRAWSDAIITSAANLRSEPDLDHRAPRSEWERLAEWRSEVGRGKVDHPRVFVLTREGRTEAELDALRTHGVFHRDDPAVLLPGGRLPRPSPLAVRQESEGHDVEGGAGEGGAGEGEAGEGEAGEGEAGAGEALATALRTVAAEMSNGHKGDGGDDDNHGSGNATASLPNVLVECGAASTSSLIAGQGRFRYILLTIVSGLDGEGGASPLAPVQPLDRRGYRLACESEAIEEDDSDFSFRLLLLERE